MGRDTAAILSTASLLGRELMMDDLGEIAGCASEEPEEHLAAAAAAKVMNAFGVYYLHPLDTFATSRSAAW